MNRSLKKPLVPFAVGVFSLFFFVSTAPADDLDLFRGHKGAVNISGGTAHIPVMKEVAKRALTVNPDIQITIAGGGTGVGIKQVGEQMVQIGNAGRKPTEAEIKQHGLVLFQWAIDGVGVVVNPKNKVQALTGSQLRDIYAGKIANWKELGGADRVINLYTRDEASGTREVFVGKALKKGAVSAKANVVVSNGAMKTAIANDPFGIGYVSVGHIDSSVAPVALDGVAPTEENVRDGKYKVARGLFSLTAGQPQGLTKAFLDYLFSTSGQRIVIDKGFIPVR